jgi:hypothetical protein
MHSGSPSRYSQLEKAVRKFPELKKKLEPPTYVGGYATLARLVFECAGGGYADLLAAVEFNGIELNPWSRSFIIELNRIITDG